MMQESSGTACPFFDEKLGCERLYNPAVVMPVS